LFDCSEEKFEEKVHKFHVNVEIFFFIILEMFEDIQNKRKINAHCEIR